MMFNMKVIATAIGLFFFCLQPVLAANDALDLAAAQALLESGEPHNALDFLHAGLDSESTNIQEWFMLAMAAKASNRPREATKYLTKIIELDPAQAGRAKLELAQLSYTLGNAEQAKIYLAEVKATKPPAKVGENIDQFLEMIESRGVPKNWRLNTAVAWMYDSNANAGPSTNSVLMFGLPFTLSEMAQERDDSALVYSVGFDHSIGLTDDLGWQSALSLNHTDYTVIDSLDSTVISGSTGLSMRVMDDLVLSVPLVVDWVKFGHESSYYSYSYGIAPQLRYSLTERFSLNLGTTLSKKKYLDNSDRNSENYSLSPSLAYQISQISFARLGLVLGREDSGLAYFENDLWGASAMYGHVLFGCLQLTLNLSYTDNDYAGKEAAYTDPRHDKATRGGIDLTYRIKVIDTDLLLSAVRTVNDSNLIMYEYDRDQVSISVRKTF